MAMFLSAGYTLIPSLDLVQHKREERRTLAANTTNSYSTDYEKLNQEILVETRYTLSGRHRYCGLAEEKARVPFEISGRAPTASNPAGYYI